MRSAKSDPDFRSARRRSPAERWAQLSFSESRAHWVPLPAPGPPSTKTTWNFSSVVVSAIFDWLDFLRILLEYARAVDAKRNTEKGQKDNLGIVLG